MSCLSVCIGHYEVNVPFNCLSPYLSVCFCLSVCYDPVSMSPKCSVYLSFCVSGLLSPCHSPRALLWASFSLEKQLPVCSVVRLGLDAWGQQLQQHQRLW